MTSHPRGYTVDFAVEVDDAPDDQSRLREAVSNILEDSEYQSAQISVAIVDDSTIHDLNRRYLEHDYPTDVLSFVLADDQGHLEGQLVVSLDTATAQASEYGWSREDELLLYVVHGTLHLVGYDDATPDDRAEMRGQETRVLKRFGLAPRYDEPAPPTAMPTNGVDEKERT